MAGGLPKRGVKAEELKCKKCDKPMKESSSCSDQQCPQKPSEG